MTTSGVVNRTQLDVAELIELAADKCGALSSTITGEQLRKARRLLFLQLVALTNRGVNLWCVTKRVIEPLENEQNLQLSNDVVDLLTVLFRYGTSTPADTYNAATASVTYVDATQVTSATYVVPAAGDYHLVLEAAADDLVWFEAGSTFYPDAQAGRGIGVDAVLGPTVRHWRVRETVRSVTVLSAKFWSATTDLPTTIFSRDQYTIQPNKNFPASRLLNYFFDKQTPNPLIWVWPVLSAPGGQLVLWIQRQIQDVGALTNTLDVPGRWLNAIVYTLASELYLMLPANLVAPDRYQILVTQAEKFTRSAEDGEIDGGPMRLMFNISPYTR